MASEVDQVSAQAHTAPPASAPEVPKSSEEAPLALQPKEDKSAVAAEPPKADDNLSSSEPAGTGANDTEKEDSAATKAEDTVNDAVQSVKETVQDTVQSVKDTVQSVVGGEQEEAAPKEPVMTGALPSEPEPTANADAPAPDAGFPIGEHKDDSAAQAEKPAAETNGSETKDAAASAEDAVVGEKHKAEEPLDTNGDAKKAKVTNGNGEARKPGRPSKKDKKPQPTPQQTKGQTVRKTRSQGPVEV